MALNDLPRTSRTLLTAIGLSALYLLYSQITRPMLTVNRSPQIARSATRGSGEVITDLCHVGQSLVAAASVGE